MADQGLLRRAAQRAGARPFFLAAPMLAYAAAEALDDAALAARLGCDVAHLPALLLCRRPTGRGAAFRADVERIAQRFGLDVASLAEVLRLAEALEALAKAPQAGQAGLLAAARDRDDEEPDQ
jgi:hypothetical protein